MQTKPSTAGPMRPLWVVVLAAGIIVALAMGLRQVMGLFLAPMSADLGFGREPFSLAIAVANLVWGISAMPMGAIADRFGTGRVIVAGTLTSIAGFFMMYSAHTGLDLIISGVLLGIGIGGTGITVLVGAVGRAAPPERRTQAMASLGMAAGIGSFVAFPYVHLFMEMFGWQGSLLVIMATLALLIPLAPFVSSGRVELATAKKQTLGAAVAEALAHPSFWLLTVGFFVCGFHVAFYSVHLPAFVTDNGLSGSIAVIALTCVGIANIIGTYVAGQVSRRIEKRVALSWIYFLRCFAFLGLLYLPINEVTIIGISVFLGFFWLSTVPLTSALVGTFFGTTWMSMLFGFVFLSHQLGSFSGLWLAGVLYDATKSYTMMWWISVALGLFAALVHWPIRERPVSRLVPQPAE